MNFKTIFFTGCSRSKIESPGFPSNYPGSLRCQWLLTSKDNNSIVQFRADNIDLEKCNRPCGCDYLEIFDGATTSSNRLGKFCSGRVRMFSSGRHMLVVFHADQSGSGSGFSASFKNVSHNSGELRRILILYDWNITNTYHKLPV